MPQAVGPVAFSLVAQSLTGDARGGAAMILAMTLAQVAGAIPITRLGRTRPAATVLRLLVAFRTLALATICLCAYARAPFGWLIAFAALAGLVNGAASGYLRALLNHFTPSANLPRALGIAATLNELTFVLGPVVASGLGTVSPIFAALALTLLGAIPAVLIPQAHRTPESAPHAAASVLSPSILLWLACAAAGGSTVAAIEIGSVSLALKFGYEPTLAILFTVPGFGRGWHLGQRAQPVGEPEIGRTEALCHDTRRGARRIRIWAHGPGSMHNSSPSGSRTADGNRL